MSLGSLGEGSKLYPHRNDFAPLHSNRCETANVNVMSLQLSPRYVMISQLVDACKRCSAKATIPAAYVYRSLNLNIARGREKLDREV